MLLAFKLGQVVLVKASSPSCFTFRVSISSSPAVRPWLGNSGGGSGWLKQFGLFCSSTTGCTGKGSKAARGLGSAAAVQILQPGQWCWLLEEVSTVHFNSFQLGGKLLDCSLSSKNILPHDAEF